MNYAESNKQKGIEVRKRMLNAIKDYIQQHGYPPTVREIGDIVGLYSTSSVHAHLQRMLADGALETDHPGMPRAIRVPGMRIVFEEVG
ncbi:MAG: hypothetical protein Q4C52_13500 [Eubacteriales bacterium]|nr:hypothetical protein [Eubacteriales bacterium]